MNRSTVAGAVIGALTLLFALGPLVRGEVELPTAQHHFLHAGIIAGAALSGVLVSPAGRRPARLAPVGLLIAVIAPVLAMFLMWPSEYAFLDRHPGGHAIEHVGLAILSFGTTFAGECFAAGVGWTAGLALLIMALLAPLGFGVSPGPAAIAALPSPASGGVAASGGASGNARHGSIVYGQSCASCHGVRGQGGVGPSLKQERARKDVRQTVQWIENPAPPMPKLYPTTLSERDVRDVAAFVQNL